MKIPVVIHHNKDSAYWVTMPDLAGCFSAGKTLEDALTNALETICVYMERVIESGEPWPTISALEACIDDEDGQGGFWYLINLDDVELSKLTDKINVTVPRLDLYRFDQFIKANPHYSNRSQFLVTAAHNEMKRTNLALANTD